MVQGCATKFITLAQIRIELRYQLKHPKILGLLLVFLVRQAARQAKHIDTCVCDGRANRILTIEYCFDILKIVVDDVRVND